MIAFRLSCVVICLGGSAAVCSAQSLFGSGGALSTTASSNASTSSNTTGGNNFLGSNALGSSGGMTASSGGGQSSLSQSQLNTGDGSLGATIGSSGFVGRSDNSGRFVGNQNAGNQSGSNLSRQFSQLQNLIGNNQNNNNSASQQPALQIRPRMQLGFQVPTLTSSELQTSVQPRVTSLPGMTDRGGSVKVQADENGQVTLTGTVASERDKQMMEILTRMEPGVRSVRNELLVAP